MMKTGTMDLPNAWAYCFVESKMLMPGKEETFTMKFSFYLLFNADASEVPYILPASLQDDHWEKVLETNGPHFSGDRKLYKAGDTLMVPGRSLDL